MSEFAILAEYSVVSKILDLIRGDKLLTNSKELNYSVYKYMFRICETLSAEWIFFQTDYLNIFNEIINNIEITNRFEYRPLLTLIRTILKSFFQLLKKNNLLVVETLFRFLDKSTKDAIVTNYEELIDEGAEMEDNLNNFVDDRDIFDPLSKASQFQWTEIEDKTLINHYDEYKNIYNCEEQLMLILSQLGFTNKSITDIKRRIKFLKLKKGRAIAEQVFKEIHTSFKLSIEDAVCQSLQNIHPEKFTKEDLLEFFQRIFKNFEEFKILITEQEGTFSALSNAIDFCIVPLTEKDFDILYWSQIESLFSSLSIKKPMKGEWMWRIPSFVTNKEIQEQLEQLTKAIINPNPKQSEQQLQEQNQNSVEGSKNRGMDDEEESNGKNFDDYCLESQDNDADESNFDSENKQNSQKNVNNMSDLEENEYMINDEKFVKINNKKKSQDNEQIIDDTELLKNKEIQSTIVLPTLNDTDNASDIQIQEEQSQKSSKKQYALEENFQNQNKIQDEIPLQVVNSQDSRNQGLFNFEDNSSSDNNNINNNRQIQQQQIPNIDPTLVLPTLENNGDNDFSMIDQFFAKDNSNSKKTENTEEQENYL